MYSMVGINDSVCFVGVVGCLVRRENACLNSVCKSSCFFSSGGGEVKSLNDSVVSLKSRRKISGRHVVMLGAKDDQGRVRIATPFGVVSRDPYSLPPMVSKAAEMKTLEFAENSHRLEELKIALNRSASGPQLAALQELCFYPPEEAVPLLVQTMQKSIDEMARSQATFACLLIMENEQVTSEILSKCYEAVEYALKSDGSPTVRSAAAAVVGAVLDPEYVDRASQVLTRQLMEETDWLVKMCLAVALGTRGDKNAVTTLLPMLQRNAIEDCSNQSLVIQGIIGALGQLGAVEALPEFQRWSGCDDSMIRMQVAEALQGFGPEEGVIELAESLKTDENALVRQQADGSLQVLLRKLE
mmetsp:Transcript_10646/g.19203  ORF Transcript_10646/g.19203 Transcript_10646/m.19203 type:complete len:357 (-) Transcript_10646:1499-2569(-)